MSKAAQLKKRASEFEQKKQYDRALAMYVQAIEAADTPDAIDIPVYNRVGDLHLRLGSLEQAVMYYEMAVDLYAESGFFNNAIALCNKVLRHAPSRSAIYYKLGKISAKKGFNSDAKQNFLEYADRMQKAGEIDEAFRALKEFADLCPGQDDVRLMLADQLARASRPEEALEQLHIVHDAMVAEDRTTEAMATLERMRALDPTVQPRQSPTHRPKQHAGLVFIDIDSNYGGAPSKGAHAPPQAPSPEREETVRDEPPPETTEEPSTPEAHGGGEEPLAAAGLAPVDSPEVLETSSVPPAQDRDTFFETTSFSVDPVVELPASIVDEPTMFVSEPSAWTEGAPTSPAPAEPAGASPSNDMALDEGPLAGAVPEASEHPPVDVFDDLAASVSPEPVQSEPAPEPSMAAGSIVEPSAPPRSGGAAPSRDDEFVDLQAWLQETEPPKNPRMTASYEEPPPGTIQTDFTEMLDMFKRGVAQNVDESDSDSHYDLGVAYMEMELFEEAIAQFQKAMRAHPTPDRRVRVYESLGRCFIEQGQYDVAIASLAGALHAPGMTDGTLVGVLYLLGVASEALESWRDAAAYYKRVFAVDINFRDVGERLRRAVRNGTVAPAP